MAVIPIPKRTESDRDFATEVEQILIEIRFLRTMLDAWTPPPNRLRAPVIPIDVRRPISPRP